MFPPFGFVFAHGRKMLPESRPAGVNRNKKQTTAAHPSHLKSTKSVLW
jgi:hypothetical protein